MDTVRYPEFACQGMIWGSYNNMSQAVRDWERGGWRGKGNVFSHGLLRRFHVSLIGRLGVLKTS